jgi:hypothetical protein
MNSYPFKGWDWTELSEKWGLYLNGDQIDILEGEEILFRHYLNGLLFSLCAFGNVRRVSAAACSDIRNYLKALSKNPGYEAPAWEGLSRVEDDFSLLRLFIDLFPLAWS